VALLGQAYLTRLGRKATAADLAKLPPVRGAYTDEAVFAATAQLAHYRNWDLTWQRVSEVGRLDAFNQVAYLIADAPPAPYSFIITPRDFVVVRASVRLPGCRTSATLYRHALHARAPEVWADGGAAAAAELARGAAAGGEDAGLCAAELEAARGGGAA
jgi:hypothetical protein